MSYWQKISFILRKDRKLYYLYGENLYKRITGFEIPGKRSVVKKSSKNAFYFILLRLKVFYHLAKIYKYVTRQFSIISNMHDTNAIYGVFSNEFKDQYRKKINNINGFFSIYTLQEIKQSLSKYSDVLEESFKARK
jgi:hypothetical protein